MFLEVLAVINRTRKPQPGKQHVGDRLAAACGQLRGSRPGVEGFVAEGGGDHYGEIINYYPPWPLARAV